MTKNYFLKIDSLLASMIDRLEQMHFSYLFLFPLFIHFLTLNGFAQQPNYAELGRPIVQNFSPDDYNAFPQNWSITQFEDRRMVVGNVDGFLTYDGEQWDLLHSKNTVRVVFRASDGIIYAGLKSDFGYLTADEKGRLQFVSLLHLTGKNSDEIGDIWEIAEHENAIIFRHNEGFFAWDGKVLISQQAEKRFVNSFKVSNRFFVLDESKGLYEYKNGTLDLLPSTQSLSTNKVAAILPHSRDSLFVITQTNGFFWLTDKGISTRNHPLKKQLNDEKVYAAIRLSNRQVVLGTINNGLYWFDEEMNLISHLNKKSGLIDDSILSFYEELDSGALWVAAYNGLARVSIHLSVTEFGEQEGISGSVHGITRFGDQLYIATNQGVSAYRAQDEFTKEFRRIRLPLTQTWALEASKDRLIIAASEGLVLYRGGFLQFLDRMSSYCISPVPMIENQFLVGRKEGLFLLDLKNAYSPILQKIDDTNEEIRSIAWEGTKKVWLGLANNGTQRIEFTDDFKTGTVVRFDSTYGLPDSWLDVANLGNEIVFLAMDGLYGFNPSTQRFFKRDNPVLKNNATRAGMVFNAAPNEYWLTDSNRHTYAFKRSGAEFNPIPTEIDILENLNMFARYKDNDGTVWIGHTNKLYRIQPKEVNRVPEASTPVITGFTYSDSIKTYYGWSQDKQPEITLPSDFKSLRVSFANPSYDSQHRSKYQVRVLGYDENWSRMSTDSFKEFTNLSKGSYTLEIRSETIFGQITPVSSVQFSVKAGMFNSWYSYIIYLLLIAGFSQIISITVKQVEQRKAEAELKRQQESADLEKSKLRAEAAELRAQTAEYQVKMAEEESRRKTEELKQAREIQQHFLPKEAPDSPLLDIAAVQKTATEVGGDYYDYLISKPNDATLVIGDATGHGVGAGLLVASTKSALFSLIQRDVQPTAEQLNRILHLLTLDKRLFMALLLARFIKEPKSNKIVLHLSGGAIPPVYILRANGSVEEYLIAGLPLGASLKQTYSTFEIDLETDDMVILYSDGLPERQNAKGDELGYERLHKLLKGFGNLYGKMDSRKKAKASNVADLMLSIGEKWSEGTSQQDDITVLVAKVK